MPHRLCGFPHATLFGAQWLQPAEGGDHPGIGEHEMPEQRPPHGDDGARNVDD